MSSPQPPLFGSPAEAPRNGHTIVIIDGHALAFRSYFAIRELTNSRGRPTNAVYGFIRSLLRILREEGEHDATVVTFDAPAPSFRHEQYEDYKAGRAPTPEDLPDQIATIKRLVDLLGLYRIEVPGLEADDLIGTIASRCASRGYAVEIVTSDRDAYQLVGEHICVRGLDKQERFGPEEVFAKYGVTVEQWTDYRALTGDSSDNIPGARGIGPVSARKLLERYGTLDYILENLDGIEPRSQAEKIRASQDDVRFSRELSRIVTDADIEIAPEAWAKREPQTEALTELLTELEFGSILRELDLSSARRYRRVPWGGVEASGAVGYVLSESSPMRAELTDLAVAAGGEVATAPDEASREAFLRRHPRASACDAKALAVYAGSRGIPVEPGEDPLLLAYLLDPGSAQPEAAARRYGAGEWGQDAASRAQVAAELMRILGERLEPRQRDLYTTLERPLQAVLAKMELSGITLDTELLERKSRELGERLAAIEDRVRTIAGDPGLNLNSRDQLAELLYDRLELQPGRKTATGKRSTAVSALEPLRSQHEVIGLILDYRELAKLKSTYLDPLPRLVHPRTGRIHTTFNQAVVATGRLSSTNPNLQNIPVRTEVGRQIRQAFVAAPGTQLLVADYSQIELRVLAHVAREEALIEAFRAGEDIHRRTAAKIHGVAMNDVTAEMRRVAKVINFGVLYGMSAHRLTRELDIPFEEAEHFIATYFEGYPRVRSYIEETLAACRERGYVETLLGRRRPIPDIRSGNRNAREYAERTAYNMPIQGTAADIMKLAMLKLDPLLEDMETRMLLQVHDELVLETRAERAQEAAAAVRATMEAAFDLDVPLVAEVGIGSSWLEAK